MSMRKLIYVILNPSTGSGQTSRKDDDVILSAAKDLEILRRFAPQNDIRKEGFRMETNLNWIALVELEGIPLL